MKISSLEYLAYAALAILVLSVDRVTKIYALNNFQIPKVITSFLTGELAFNKGISWGMFNAADGSNFLAVSLLVFAVTCVLGYYAYTRLSNGYTVYGELLIMMGSISNMLDRMWYAGVVDFISFHLSSPWGIYAFPTFNIADCCIVLGVCVMFLQMMQEN